MILKILKLCTSVLFLATISTQSFGIISEEESSSASSLRPISGSEWLGSLKAFARNSIAFSYYMTSVVGYGSRAGPIGKFFENFPISAEFQRDHKCKTRTEDGVRTDCSIQYLKKEDANSITIVPHSFTRSVTTSGYDSKFESQIYFFQTEETFFDEAIPFLKEFLGETKGKKLIIHGHIKTHGMHSGFLRTIFGKGNHVCQITLQIDPAEKDMLVIVTDSASKKIKKILGGFTGLTSNCERIEDFFSKVAGDFSLTLNLEYLDRGDQLLNRHDCGRFSTIYLLARLQGKNPKYLSAEDIYYGFKALEKGRYDIFHQEEGRRTSSLFSRVCAPRRWLTDLFFSLVG